MTAAAFNKRGASLNVFTNDPANSSVELRFSWLLMESLGIEPREIDFGTLFAGDCAEQTVHLVCNDSEAFSDCRIDEVNPLSAANAEDAQLSAELLHKSADSGCKARVKLIASQNPGRYRGSIQLKLEGCRRDRFTVPVSWRVRGRIEATPSSLLLGSGPARAVRTATLVVSSCPNEALEIEALRINGSGERVQLEQRRIGPDRIAVTVSHRLPSEAGIHRTQLTIVSAEPVRQLLRIPISMYVSEEGDR